LNIFSGRSVFNNNGGAIYRALKHFEPSLCVDVGAAAGHLTKYMLISQPECTVLAFEPFPGNYTFFNNTIGEDSRVTLRKAAVSDHVGVQSFDIGPTVSKGTAGWASMTGYSSVGRLINQNDELRGEKLEVEVTTIDNEISDDVLLMKIDVQGHEAQVLRGAENLLKKQRVKLLFVEFDGDIEVLEIMNEKDYVVYDNEYLIIPRDADDNLEGWNIVREVNLSTGRTAYNGWPECRPNNSKKYTEWFNGQRQRFLNLNTDLLFVSRNFTKIFERGARALNGAGG
jgi:FkbM family methyltransferase